MHRLLQVGSSEPALALIYLVVALSSLILILDFTLGKTVTVMADGCSLRVHTWRSRVDGALSAAGVSPRGRDLLRPAVTTALVNGMTIRVIRVEEKIIREEQILAYRVQSYPSRGLRPGERQVMQRGQNGVMYHTYRVVYHDGREYQRRLLASKRVQAPQDEVVLVGATTPAAPAAEVSRGLRVERTLIMEATAYTSTGFRTATGIMPSRGVVAVDTRVIPLGTRLYIEGYGEAVAADTGGDMRGNRIDLFFSSAEECRLWGRRKVKVDILEN